MYLDSNAACGVWSCVCMHFVSWMNYEWSFLQKKSFQNQGGYNKYTTPQKWHHATFSYIDREGIGDNDREGIGEPIPMNIQYRVLRLNSSGSSMLAAD